MEDAPEQNNDANCQCIVRPALQEILYASGAMEQNEPDAKRQCIVRPLNNVASTPGQKFKTFCNVIRQSLKNPKSFEL